MTRLNTLTITRCMTVIVLGLACSSCGDGPGRLQPVRGKVLVNGVAAAGAFVVFHPIGGAADVARPSAIADQDGAFDLRTEGQVGAVPGDYTVTVVWESPGTRKETTTDKLKGKYSQPAESKLRVTVSTSFNELAPFELR